MATYTAGFLELQFAKNGDAGADGAILGVWTDMELQRIG